MKIIVHSTIGDGDIRTSLGADDYSYYFVRRTFSEALRRFAEVVVVSDPAAEVDSIYDRARADGERCLFLSFVPPHKTVLGLRCPVVPVFAWEFSTIPNEVWNDDIRNDWRAVFAVSEAAIALSSYTAGVVRAAMGQSFPIVAIPTPVFEQFRSEKTGAVADKVAIVVTGTVLDTNEEAVFRAAPVWPPDPPVPLLTPGPLPVLVLPPSLAPEAIEPEPVPAARLAEDPPPPDNGDHAVSPTDELPAVVIAVPDPEPERRIGLRRRVQITRHLALEWYRLTVRDLLPGPVRAANALAGRTLHRTRNRLRRRHPLPAQLDALPLEVFASPSPDESVLAIAPPAPEPWDLAGPVAVETVDDPVAEVPVSAEAIAVEPEPIVPAVPVTLDGVVFVSMFSPRDGRKNWNDIVTAFCWAFRDEPGATLVLKIVAADHGYEDGLRRLLRELAPLRCRVVVLHGFLETADYRALIGAASFYVNASHCEGLCLPMLEFMSAGTPAIAPCHTAFTDYVSPANSFVVAAGIEHTVWPGDGRDLFRTTRYRVDWHELMLRYREAFHVARQEPERYAAMSDAARATMERFCGLDTVTASLRTLLLEHNGSSLERAA